MTRGEVTLLITSLSLISRDWYVTSVTWANSTTVSLGLVSRNFSLSVVELCRAPSFICSQVRQTFIMDGSSDKYNERSSESTIDSESTVSSIST